MWWAKGLVQENNPLVIGLGFPYASEPRGTSQVMLSQGCDNGKMEEMRIRSLVEFDRPLATSVTTWTTPYSIGGRQLLHSGESRMKTR